MQNFIKKYFLLAITFITGLIFLSFIAPFASWIILAVIFATALKPLQKDILIKRLKFSKTFSVYGMLFVMVLFFVPFVFSFISMFSNIRSQLSQIKTNKSISSVEEVIHETYSRVGVLAKLAPEEKAIEYSLKGIEKGISGLISYISNAFTKLPHFLLSLFFFSATLFYFVIDAGRLRKHFANFKFIDPHELNKLISIFQTSSQSTLYAALLTGFVQSLIVALTAKLLGFNFFVTTTFITFFLSQIPLVGTTPVSAFIVAYFYFHHNIPAMVVMIVAGILAGVSDNIVRVWFLSKYDSLHPLAGFFAALGGMVTLGPLGVLIGPVLTMTFFKLMDYELAET